jgi:protein-S-isoprenylcysteine O-methyltransferase Ste14
MPVREYFTIFYLIFFLAAFILRFAIRRRTLGSKRIKGRIYAKWTTRYIFYTYLLVLSGSLAEYFIFKKAPLLTVSGLGLILYVIGIAGRQWAHRSLGAYWSVDIEIRKNHQIIRKGPYKFMRHPNSLFNILEMAGIILIPNSYFSLVLFVLIYLPVIIYRSLTEEKIMGKSLGKSYRKYKAETKGLIPFPARRGASR